MNGIDVLRDMLAPNGMEGRYYGVMPGIVTNNQDPDGLARVKVRFPWLSDSDESYWARLTTAMAGDGFGTYFLPEVDDEVLVAFEHGRVNSPYILGAVWNGKNKPPVSNADGKNNARVIKSRSGSTIKLDDTQGSEKVEITGKDGGVGIVFDLSNNSIKISAKGNLSITAEGTLKLHGQQVEIKGERVDIN